MARIEFKTASNPLEVLEPQIFEPEFDDDSIEPFRVRDLITKLVAESVRDFHVREKDRAIQFLTPERIDQGLEQGRFGSPREEAQRVETDVAIGQALQAFEDKLYLLFIDDTEKRSLEELVVLQPETVVTIIRLTALAGR